MSADKENDYVAYLPRDIMRRMAISTDKLMLAYAWSNPDIKASGCFDFKIFNVMQNTGYSADVVNESISRLAGSNEIFYDTNTEEVFVPTWLDHNYLQDGSPAASPSKVLESIASIKSNVLKQLATKDAIKLDIHYDASI